MNKIKVKVIADSISEAGIRLATMHLRYPRIVHSELMTHRVFSRNARSSRAVPVATMLKEVMKEPFIPWHWGKNQKGMQADEECDELVDMSAIHDLPFMDCLTREEAWLLLRDNAVRGAEAFSKAGYHKQIANRLIEPFAYIDTLVSSTDWANWDALRDHADAEPHIADLAREMKIERHNSEPEPLKHGEWHLPYVSKQEQVDIWLDEFGGNQGNGPEASDNHLRLLVKLSTARCARISYKPFDDNGSIEKEVERHDMLVGSTPLHASPAEHQATPDKIVFNYRDGMDTSDWDSEHLHGNFRGWKQYRKMLPNECTYEGQKI
ncbi:MAG: hypothetical protein ACEQSB_00590 [Undibacterium sp.]